ncbi:MAG: 50S ribosomal protein L25/general stress protein Ctc [Propionibacteriaceae bacterium]|jgi:large subunit ribosomal protein L25|nr:50S ribosomal protein L25/general stress protein Ctc [Propionibacteriaceae bacterium]
MAEITIAAKTRDEFGKGAARRLRRDKLIPAVLYGHGGETVHLALPAHATTMALRTANALLDLEVEGGKSQLALPKQIQRDPVKDTIEHVDLIIVRRGEKVHVEVPLVVTGEPRGEAVVILEQNSLMLEVEATHIPPHIDIDVEGQEVGYTLTAADLVLPEGALYTGESEDVIVSIQTPQAKDMGESTEEASADEAGDDAEAAAEE